MSQLSKRDKCKTRGCEHLWVASGYCVYHYLKRLDALEKRGRKSKLMAGGGK